MRCFACQMCCFDVLAPQIDDAAKAPLWFQQVIEFVMASVAFHFKGFLVGES